MCVCKCYVSYEAAVIEQQTSILRYMRTRRHSKYRTSADGEGFVCVCVCDDAGGSTCLGCEIVSECHIKII